MDLTSLLITLIGIIVLLGLYIMSRFYEHSSTRHLDKTIKIPRFTDAEGYELSSIMADYPAREVGRNAIKPTVKQAALEQASTTTQNASAPSNSTSDKQQHVLFISSQTSHQLDGDSIIAAMKKHQLNLGENDIYHYTVKKGKCLFSVANGVAPWTLKDTDLAGKTTPGLSLVMPIPTPIDSVTAIETFVEIAENLATSIHGELQNTQQRRFLDADKEAMLKHV